MTTLTTDLDDPKAARQAMAKKRALAELNRNPFRPAWWLGNAHFQSSWAVFFRKRPEVQPRKERWDTPDGDFINVFIIDGKPGRPTALLLHGLEGSARSNYMVGLQHRFSELGWRVVAIEHRSCGGEINRNRQMYHSGWTEDLAYVVSRLTEERPESRIYISGFSLGGNQTAKWLGEMGEDAPKNVAAAAVVSPPFNLAVSGPNMDAVLWGAYTKWFMRTLVPKAIEKERQFPGSLDLEKIEQCRTFRDFDTYATAALHGFRDAEHYWESVGCGQFLEGVRRPLLLIAAADDPFNPGSTLPRELAERHPYLHAQFTEKGGHCGFVHGPSPSRSRHWAEEQIVRFFLTYEDGSDA